MALESGGKAVSLSTQRCNLEEQDLRMVPASFGKDRAALWISRLI